VRNFLPESALKTLYFTLFHCHLIYAVEIWGSANLASLNKIFKKQKAAVRIISNSKYNSHTEPIFKKLEILKFHDIIDQSKIKFMFSVICNKAPLLLREEWTTNRTRREALAEAQHPWVNLRGLRNEEDFFEPFARIEMTAKMPLYSFPKIWNNLSPDLKLIRSKPLFESKLKQKFLANYVDNYICARLFCPACITNL
jgi:hypothetical protein